MSVRQQNVRPRSDMSFEQGMHEPLLRRGSDMPIEMREFRSSSIKRVTQRFMESDPDRDERKTKVTTRQIVGHILPLVWRKGDCCTRCMTFMAFLFLLLVVILIVLAPIALKFAVDGLVISFKNFITVLAQTTTLFETSETSTPLFLNTVPKSWDNDFNPTFWVSIYVGIRFLAAILLELRNWCFASALSVGEVAISKEAMTHVMTQALSYHQRRETSKVLRVITRASLGFGTVTRVLLFYVVPVFIEAVLILVVLVVLLPWYYCVILLGAIILYLLVSWGLYVWKTKMLQDKGRKELKYNQRAADALNNFESVKYFNAEEHEINRFVDSLYQYRGESMRVAGNSVLITFIHQLIVAGAFATLLILGCYDVYDATIEIGDWVMVLAFLLSLFLSLNLLNTYCRQMRHGAREADDIIDIMARGEKIPEPMAPLVPRFSSGKLEFKNVSFSYEKGYTPNPKMVLKNVSFTVEPGERVAIVGPAGSGKSTIMRLLYRFYDVIGGEITLDGYDIRAIKSKDLRSGIAIVPQDCRLFNDTIQYNIGYGGVSHDEKSVDYIQDIEHAARKAGVIDFILSRSDDYKTVVGPNSVEIPLVEKQRLAIARALLKRGAVLFCFDATTSTLDSVDEGSVQQTIKEVTEGTTTVIIAHRLAAIKDCDKIIVLKHGFVAEVGKHEELMNLRDGTYRRIWDEQERMVKDEMEEALLGTKSPNKLPVPFPNHVDAHGPSFSE